MPITADLLVACSSKSLSHRPLMSFTSSTEGKSTSLASTGMGTASYLSFASLYGVTTMFASSCTLATDFTVMTLRARSSTSSGSVGSWPPNALDAETSMRLVPSLLTFALRSPLALSVRPTAAMMAATPIIGPSNSNSVRTLRAKRPVSETIRRSLNVFIAPLSCRSRCDRRASIPYETQHRPLRGRG